MAPAVVQAIHSVDPDQPVYDVRPMAVVLARSAADRWLNMAIIGAFAAASLLLSGAGLYGVVASGVTDRRREFGVRLALAAAPRSRIRQGRSGRNNVRPRHRAGLQACLQRKLEVVGTDPHAERVIVLVKER